MALPAACVGALTGIVVKLVQRIPAARRTPRAATMFGRLVALVLWPLLYMGLYAILRQRIAPVYLETFMFWYFMPGLIYLVPDRLWGQTVGLRLTRRAADTLARRIRPKKTCGA